MKERCQKRPKSKKKPAKCGMVVCVKKKGGVLQKQYCEKESRDHIGTGLDPLGIAAAEGEKPRLAACRYACVVLAEGGDGEDAVFSNLAKPIITCRRQS